MSALDEETEIINEQKLAFERVFKSTDGETILYVLGNRCIPEMGMYEPDPYKMAFKEGQRNILLTILKTASIRMDEFLKKHDLIKRREEKWTH